MDNFIYRHFYNCFLVVGCEKEVVSKPISLRPSTEEQAILDNYMKANKIKKPSVALKQIIRDFATLQTQLEQQQLEKKPQIPFSPLDEKEASKIVQILAFYPMRFMCPKDREFYLAETIIEQCKDCPTKTRKQCMVHRVPQL